MTGVWNLKRGDLFRAGKLILEFERLDGFYCRAWTRTGQLVLIGGYVEVVN